MASPKPLFLHLSLILLLSLSAADDGAVMAKLASSFTPAPSDWTGNSYCDWSGINCDNSNQVTSINLASKSLSGTLPAELSQLSQLKTLALQRNSLAGSLPSLANLSSLQEIFLDANAFTLIPKDFLLGLNNLQTLSISDNPKLSPWQIPPFLTESSSLGTFTASNSSIVGSIPNFFDSFPNLQNLRLSYNTLTGILPKSLGGSEIQNLWLNNQLGNGLSGSIDVLSSMSQLSQVWLHGNAFTGPVPDLSKCINLFDLQLRDNQFTGVIPPSLMELPELINISLQNNKFQGPVPVFKNGVKSTLGTTNSFCRDNPGPCDPQVNVLLAVAGAIGYPMTLAESWEGNDACAKWTFVTCDSQGKSVTVVNFAKQQFLGTISPAFANLTSLRSLLLNGNDLTGSIPESLTTLPDLQVLDVSNNNLSGPIPVFPPTVKFTTTGNSLLGKNISGGGGGNGNTPGSGPNPNTPSRSPPEESKGGSGSSGMIAGVIIAVLVFVGVVLFVSYKCYVKKRHQRFGRVQSPEKGKEMVNGNIMSGLNKKRERELKMAEKPQPVRVLYCGVCGLPAEYCEFGPDFEKCKPWLIQNAPDLYPDLLKDAKDADKVSDQLRATSISDKTSSSVGSSTSKQEEVKRLPGGKIKKKEKQEVIIEKVTRNKRKSITTVKGLELFGVKLSDASKKLGKKFATGASVVKGPTEKEQIDVQGDISFDVVDFITDTWPDVPETAIYFIEDGKKVAAA